MGVAQAFDLNQIWAWLRLYLTPKGDQYERGSGF